MDHLYVRQNDLVWREVDDEIVILDSKQSRYLSLNNAGRLLWLHLVDGASRSELADVLEQAYGLAPERAAADTQAFLSTLGDLGLMG